MVPWELEDSLEMKKNWYQELEDSLGVKKSWYQELEDSQRDQNGGIEN